VSLFTLHWPWPAAAAVLGAWQAWGPAAPDELFSNCQLLAAATRGWRAAHCQVTGVYLAAPERLQGQPGPGRRYGICDRNRLCSAQYTAC
jgi:hypothetical protein